MTTARGRLHLLQCMSWDLYAECNRINDHMLAARRRYPSIGILAHLFVAQQPGLIDVADAVFSVALNRHHLSPK